MLGCKSEAHKPRQASGGARAGGEGEVKRSGRREGSDGGVKGVGGCRVELGGGIREGGGEDFLGRSRDATGIKGVEAGQMRLFLPKSPRESGLVEKKRKVRLSDTLRF